MGIRFINYLYIISFNFTLFPFFLLCFLLLYFSVFYEYPFSFTSLKTKTKTVSWNYDTVFVSSHSSPYRRSQIHQRSCMYPGNTLCYQLQTHCLNNIKIRPLFSLITKTLLCAPLVIPKMVISLKRSLVRNPVKSLETGIPWFRETLEYCTQMSFCKYGLYLQYNAGT